MEIVQIILIEISFKINIAWSVEIVSIGNKADIYD
jgi:hypothetical protein